MIKNTVELPTGLRFIKGSRGGRNPWGNSLFVEAAGVLIDTAGEEASLLELAPRVHTLIASHFHPDHFRYNYLFKNAKLLIHEVESHALRSIDDLAEFAGTRGQPFEKKWQKLVYDRFNYTPRDNDGVIHDRERLALNSTVIEVIHTPGHSPGHCCFWFPEEQVLFLADVDLTPFGPWYGNPGSDIDDFEKSLERLSEFSARVIITGHERGLLSGEALQPELEAYSSHFEKRDHKLYEALSDQRSLDNLIRKGIIYPETAKPWYLNDHFEGVMISKHMNRLCERDLVEQIDAGLFRVKK